MKLDKRVNSDLFTAGIQPKKDFPTINFGKVHILLKRYSDFTVPFSQL